MVVVAEEVRYQLLAVVAAAALTCSGVEEVEAVASHHRDLWQVVEVEERCCVLVTEAVGVGHWVLEMGVEGVGHLCLEPEAGEVGLHHHD